MHVILQYFPLVNYDTIKKCPLYRTSFNLFVFEDINKYRVLIEQGESMGVVFIDSLINIGLSAIFDWSKDQIKKHIENYESETTQENYITRTYQAVISTLKKIKSIIDEECYYDAAEIFITDWKKYGKLDFNVPIRCLRRLGLSAKTEDCLEFINLLNSEIIKNQELFRFMVIQLTSQNANNFDHLYKLYQNIESDIKDIKDSFNGFKTDKPHKKKYHIDISLRNSIINNFFNEEYEKVIAEAYKNNILKTEFILNIFGVMYAKGLYFDRDIDEAISCFKYAVEICDLDYTISNLFVVSYLKDLQTGNLDYSHSNEALNAALWRKDKILINRLLNKSDIEGYNLILNMTKSQQEEFYKSLIIKAKVHKIIVCTEYDYCADVEIINGKTVYKNLRAIGKRFEERSIPIYIKRRNFPLFKLCDKEIEFTINGAYKTTAIWEYKSTYVGDDGRKHLWKDSENYYYGEEPPEKTEYSRWIIYGIVDGKRRFMEQVKE